MPSRFLSTRVVLAIHRDQIETFGGLPGIRDGALLESALEQPQATFGGKLLHRDIPDQAAAYLFHIVSNHPFVDGNKRVAYAAMDVFLRINGMTLTLSDDDVFNLVMRAASGQAEKEEIAQIVRRNTRPST